MARVIKTFTADVTASSKASIARAIAELTNREIAQRVRRAGEAAVVKCDALGSQFESRTQDRRRSPGTPELASTPFEVRYSGLEQVRGGQMTFRIATKAPSFWYLEFGTPPHEISPAPGKRLWWPGTLLPPGVSVQHPGNTAFRGQWRRAVALEVRDRFPGIAIPIFE